MDVSDLHDDIEEVLITEAEIHQRLKQIAREVERDYEGKEPLFIGVLKGATMVMADFLRELRIYAPLDWMAVSSYGSGTKSSGVVRILKDLDTDIHDKDIVIVEDIIDSGLTLSWLVDNLKSRGAKSVEIVTLLRKPEAITVPLDVRYVGFDIPTAFVVGYGLDYAEKYRNLRDVATLARHVYENPDTAQ